MIAAHNRGMPHFSSFLLTGTSNMANKPPIANGFRKGAPRCKKPKNNKNASITRLNFCKVVGLAILRLG